MSLPSVIAQPPRTFFKNLEENRWLEDVRREINLMRVYRYVDSNVTTNGERVMGVSSASARTITLGTRDMFLGRVLTIKDETGSAAANNITIDTQGSELIDGAATKTISTNYGYISVYSNGSNWFVIT